MDIIDVKNLRLRTRIGFSRHELDTTQDILVNLRIRCDSRRAGESDDPAITFDYKAVTKTIINFVECGHFALVEKLAEEIARIVIEDYGAPSVEVRVEKPGALRRADSVGICIERRKSDYSHNVIYVSLGSNIAPAKNLVSAIGLLRRHTTLLARSQVYRTPPQGYVNQDDFLNMAVRVHTHRSPDEFKCEVIDRVEHELGRVRDPNNVNAPRTIDLDISLWNAEELSYGEKPWTIPDADILRFAHVALPLADIAPEYVVPGEGRKLRDIAADFASSDLQRISLDIREGKI